MHGGMIMMENRPVGKYFEEWNVGDVFETNGHTITKADIVTFAGLSGDYNPLHTNFLYAKESVFGERVAHGFLIVAIASGLINQMRLFEGTTEAYLGIAEAKFTRGVLVGDTVRCIGNIAEKRITSKGGGLIKLQVNVVNQRNEVCQTRIANILITRRPAANKDS